jgi:uncharacterized protein (TIGR01777 family)
LIRKGFHMNESQPSAKSIAVTGSHGLVGAALTERLQQAGHQVFRLVRRRETKEGEIGWLPDQGWIDAAGLEGIDAVVHLAGETIQGRWSAAKKQRICDSRVQGTSLLADTLAKLTDKPAVLISASAVGFYGSRGETRLTEDSPAGTGFLAGVAEQWEAATQPALDAGLRVAIPRLGVVLSPEGGALGQMLPMFRAGMGGRLGDGKQWMSWIALDDVVGAIQHAIDDEGLAGPFNLVAPQPVTNAMFAKTLGQVLNRPAAMPAPAFMLRLALGDMADEALLASQRAEPAKLQTRGYQFACPELTEALRHLLKQAPSKASA